MSRYYAEPDGFVLRSPLLPFSVLESLCADGTARAAWESGGDVAAAVEADRAVLADRLRKVVDDAVVREAVFLASPSLDEELDRWNGTDTRPLRPLLSYVTRMTARSTPFGLFAGCSVGSIGSETELRLGPTPTRATRLDFGFLAKVVSNVTGDSNALSGLTFVPNTSLYRAGGRLRMAESRVDGRSVRYRRVTFEEDTFLTETLERARGGAKLEQLAAALVDDEVTIEEAREYVSELVDAQLLVADLGPTITGGEAVGHLVETLRPIEATAPVSEALDVAARAIADLDAGGVGAPTSRYREIADGLRKLDPDLEISRLFQVDLARPSPEMTIGPEMIGELHKIIAALHPLSRGGMEELNSFRDKFNDRYEGREVPLAEALDEEIGIGYGPPPGIAAQGAPLLAGVVPGGGGRAGGSPMSSTDGVLLRMLMGAIRDGRTEIELTEDDLKRLAASDVKPLPDSASIFVSPAADGRMLLQIITGPSGARLLGRFCHVEPGIEALVRRTLDGEASVRPAAVFAEVVHLPEGRIGNVIARPVLRTYEIPFLGRSGAPQDGQIPIDDLMVSVSGGRVVLRSKKLDREVMPRITNAHNHQTGALAIYRFFGALPQQDVAGGVRWSWGVVGSAPYLPRVTYGKFVLSRAEWNLSRDDLSGITAAKDDPVKQFEEVQKLREAMKLPRWSVVAVADNELPVDLDSVGGCELLGHEARKMGSLKLVEMFPGPDELAAVSPEGRHAAELVVALTRREPVATTVPRRADFGDDTFPPGSEWLTAKLYGGPATADAVLREAVGPLVREAGADRWFFLRYGDPDQHLRLRFNGDPQHLASVVVPAVHRHAAPLLADGRLWKVQFDTYRRETDRYGGPHSIALAEDVFHADSEAILAIVAAAEGDDGLDARWRLAVLGVDKILEDLNVDIATRQLSVRMWRDGLVREQGGTGTSAHRWGGKLFRNERAKLAALLDGQPSDQITAVGIEAYRRRSEAVAPVAVRLNELAAEGLLTRSVPDIAQSFAHLHAIRLLRAVQRVQEIVVYDLLDRLYSARKARAAK